MRTLLSVVALALMLSSSWGQGYVEFRNGRLTFRTTADPFDFYVHHMHNLRAFTLLPDHGAAISVNDIVKAEGMSGVVQAEFTVKLYRPHVDPVSVDYQTEDGSALAGQDYVATTGTLLFAAGETSKRLSIVLTADGPAEPEETFRLRLSNPLNGVLSNAVATCTITEVRMTEMRVDTTVSFNTVRNRRYGVERSHNGVDWQPVVDATRVLGTGAIMNIIDRGAGCHTSRVYRVRLVQE